MLADGTDGGIDPEATIRNDVYRILAEMKTVQWSKQASEEDRALRGRSATPCGEASNTLASVLTLPVTIGSAALLFYVLEH